MAQSIRGKYAAADDSVASLPAGVAGTGWRAGFIKVPPPEQSVTRSHFAPIKADPKGGGQPCAVIISRLHPVRLRAFRHVDSRGAALREQGCGLELPSYPITGVFSLRGIVENLTGHRLFVGSDQQDRLSFGRELKVGVQRGPCHGSVFA